MVKAAVEEAGKSGGDPGGMIAQVLHNVINQLPLLILGVFVIGLAITAFYLVRNMNEERKERDDPFYTNYKHTVQACENQADPDRIEKSWRLINLLWFGIPLLKTEKSARVVTQTGKFIGWYRGHAYTQADQCLNLLMYKNKSFFFFENLFVLKCPQHIERYVEEEDSRGRLKKVKRTIKLKDKVQFTGYGDIQVWCKSFDVTSYFWYPVFVDKHDQIIDMSVMFNEKQVNVTHAEILQGALQKGSQMVDKAMDYNPNVRYNQKVDEKTSQEEKNEEA